MTCEYDRLHPYLSSPELSGQEVHASQYIGKVDPSDTRACLVFEHMISCSIVAIVTIISCSVGIDEGYSMVQTQPYHAIPHERTGIMRF